MDQESLAQIKQVVTEATEAVEARLRGEIQQTEGRLREDIRTTEVVLRGELQQTEGRLRGEIEQTEGRLRGEIDDVKRHTGVLFEHLDHKIVLLAEGYESLHGKLEDFRSEMRQESQETRALIRSSYQALHQRVENLEQGR
jgi:uncharacterized protein YjbJ (UPF0337 family)